MRLFSKRLYHGTPHKFNEFDTEHIGTGEGAQVHGWGLYFAENKDVADSYKTNLAPDNHQYKIEMNGKEKIVDVDDEDILLGLKDFSVPEFIATAIIRIINYRNQTIYPFKSFKQALVNEISRIKIEISNNIMEGWAKEDIEKAQVYSFGMPLMRMSEAIQKFEKMLSWANEHKFDVTSININNPNKLITVEIPDDLVFAEEDEPINKQPEKVIEALNQISGDISTVVYKFLNDPSLEENIESIVRKYISLSVITSRELESMIYKFYDILNNRESYEPADVNVIARELKDYYSSNLRSDAYDNTDWDDFANELLEYANQYAHTRTYWNSFEEFYDNYSRKFSPKETSLKLESLGVNGIHYNGNQDGSCYVIFNPKHLKIINKE